VAGLTDASNFIDIAGEAVSRHRAALSAHDIAWLKSNQPAASIDGAKVAHGDFTDPAAFNYIDSEEAAEANFKVTDAQIMFVGHTHVPELFIVGASGTIHRLAPQDFVAEDGKRYIVNVGSVGYPRESNGTCMSSYVLYDTDEKAVRFRFLPFSVASVMQRGTAPRRRKSSMLIAAIALAALAGAACFALRHRPPAIADASVASISARPILARESLELDAKKRAVRANLVVESASAQLNIVFKNASGETLPGGASLTVKHRNAKKFKAPKDATAALLEVSEIPGEGTPKITEFKPEAVQ
jgi:diadenosine tetraphosphatase ApaH/serine/threonine PP2A family protein phosphatase